MKGIKLGGSKPGLGSRKGVTGAIMKGSKAGWHTNKPTVGKSMSKR